MKNIMRVAALMMLMMLVCCEAYAVSAEEEKMMTDAAQAMRKAGVVQLNFKDMDIARFVYFMSEVLQENIAVTSDMREKITIIMPHPVTIEDARKIMLSVLEQHGYSLQDEGTYSILRRKDNGGVRMRGQGSINITERLGITSGEVIRAMRGISTEEAIKDVSRVLAAVFQNQITEPKITDLKLSMVKGGEISLSYNYGLDLKKAESRVVMPASADVERGRLPVFLLERFIASPFTEMHMLRMRYNIARKGYEVQWIQANCLLKHLGVQRGDVLIGINGIMLRTLNDLDDVLHELLKKERVELVLLHKGQIVTLNYDVVSDDEPVFLKLSDDAAVNVLAVREKASGDKALSMQSMRPAEIVKCMVSNPFDELKRIRLRPTSLNDGLEVQWIQNESLLKKLGVQRGDVLKSMNGHALTERKDIVSAVTSLQKAERFELEFSRVQGGKPEVLSYDLR